MYGRAARAGAVALFYLAACSGIERVRSTVHEESALRRSPSSGYESIAACVRRELPSVIAENDSVFGTRTTTFPIVEFGPIRGDIIAYYLSEKDLMRVDTRKIAETRGGDCRPIVVHEDVHRKQNAMSIAAGRGTWPQYETDCRKLDLDGYGQKMVAEGIADHRERKGAPPRSMTLPTATAQIDRCAVPYVHGFYATAPLISRFGYRVTPLLVLNPPRGIEVINLGEWHERITRLACAEGFDHALCGLAAYKSRKD